ncbi:MAG: hypothetical protein FWE72_07040 [Spirochaetaceae bacterium]|nr:hypothetical protein [Spirochaetaceae bacterium]
MKNTIKYFCIIAVVAIIGFAMMSCGEIKQKDFYGKWVDKNDSITITANELTHIAAFYSYTMSIDSVTLMKDNRDPNYPSGFRFDGKIKKRSGDAAETGSDKEITLWLHTGKKELIVGTAARYPYKKQ